MFLASVLLSCSCPLPEASLRLSNQDDADGAVMQLNENWSLPNKDQLAKQEKESIGD